MSAQDALSDFLERLHTLPVGYSTGLYDGRRYGVTLRVSGEGRRIWLYGEELGGSDFVSFNLYATASGQPILKPCEMPAEKVVAFVLGYRPLEGDGDGAADGAT